MVLINSGCGLFPSALPFAQMEVLWSLLAIRLQEIIVELVVRPMPGITSFQAIQVVRLTKELDQRAELNFGRKKK